jgi:tripartite-type tricarboxylate transporter receptor subunit TctC
VAFGHWLAAACIVCFGSGVTLAQEVFPTKTVRIIVPWPPGGPPDVMARLVAPRMTETWGKPVIVENRAGATGTIGTDYVAKAAPDGYILLLTPSQPFVIAPAFFKVPYEPTKDVAPVAMVAEDVNVLVVHPSLGVSSVAELIALAKAKPGTLTWASSGPGSVSHLFGEMMKQIAGIDLVHVPYQGAALLMTAVVSGEVSIGFPPVLQGVPHVKAGRLKALGVTSARASQFLPEAAPLALQGLPGLTFANWYAVFAPPRTPKPLVQTLRDAFHSVFHDPSVRQKLAAVGMEEQWQEPEQIPAIIEGDLARWRRVVQAGHLSAH